MAEKKSPRSVFGSVELKKIIFEGVDLYDVIIQEEDGNGNIINPTTVFHKHKGTRADGGGCYTAHVPDYCGKDTTYYPSGDVTCGAAIDQSTIRNYGTTVYYAYNTSTGQVEPVPWGHDYRTSNCVKGHENTNSTYGAPRSTCPTVVGHYDEGYHCSSNHNNGSSGPCRAIIGWHWETECGFLNTENI